MIITALERDAPSMTKALIATHPGNSGCNRCPVLFAHLVKLARDMRVASAHFADPNLLLQLASEAEDIAGAGPAGEGRGHEPRLPAFRRKRNMWVGKRCE